MEHAGRQIKAGMFRQLDRSQLPNFQHIDPVVTARLEGCGIALMDEASDVIPAGMIYAGPDPTQIDRASVQKAVDAIRPARKDVRTFNASPIDLMAKGSRVWRRCLAATR